MEDVDEFVAGDLEPQTRTADLVTWDAGEAEDLGRTACSKAPGVAAPSVSWLS
jgi:hypothetical protein